jgi:predicted CXXCH cytochrome family protein
VPSCADCHRSHDVSGPRAADWRSHTPELCASCHADEQLMGRYGLSTAVHRTYLSDFHGVTTSLRGPAEGDGPIVARCTDCHGVHDITKVDDPKSRVLKANLVRTCQQCHKDATTNFPDAWLSHYEPSWQKAPLVHAVSLAYRVFIPFMIGGLVLQILLHLWRVVVNR